MIRRIPAIATLVVLAAVATMVGLGFWQLERLHEKEALLAQYRRAQMSDAAMPWPTSPERVTHSLFHQARLDCREVVERGTMAGRSRDGTEGMAHFALCRLADGGTARIVLGWSRDLAQPEWRGGLVSGTIAPGPRLVADPPLAGLQANAEPDPRNIPNNHLAYAVQWFFFAATALAVYALALRKRLARPASPR